MNRLPSTTTAAVSQFHGIEASEEDQQNVQEGSNTDCLLDEEGSDVFEIGRIFNDYELKEFFRSITSDKTIPTIQGNQHTTAAESLPSDQAIHACTSKKQEPREFDIGHKKIEKSAHIKRQLRIHKGEKPHKCKHCSRKFSDSVSLTKHLRVHIGKKKTYECDLCGFKFSYPSRLERHNKTKKHLDKAKDASQQRAKIIPAIQENQHKTKTETLSSYRAVHTSTRKEQRKLYECDLCAKKFPYSSKLVMHNKTKNHLYKVKDANQQRTKTIPNIQENQHNTTKSLSSDQAIPTSISKKQRKSYNCDTCHKKFRYPCLLKRHTWIHTGEQSCECDICGRTFKSPSNLKQHNKNKIHLDKVKAMMLIK